MPSRLSQQLAVVVPQQHSLHVMLLCLQALFDLEATNNELKSDLRDLYITAAKEIDVAGTSRKAIIVHVSVRCCLHSEA